MREITRSKLAAGEPTVTSRRSSSVRRIAAVAGKRLGVSAARRVWQWCAPKSSPDARWTRADDVEQSSGTRSRRKTSALRGGEAAQRDFCHSRRSSNDASLYTGVYASKPNANTHTREK